MEETCLPETNNTVVHKHTTDTETRTYTQTRHTRGVEFFNQMYWNNTFACKNALDHKQLGKVLYILLLLPPFLYKQIIVVMYTYE